MSPASPLHGPTQCTQWSVRDTGNYNRHGLTFETLTYCHILYLKSYKPVLATCKCSFVVNSFYYSTLELYNIKLPTLCFEIPSTIVTLTAVLYYGSYALRRRYSSERVIVYLSRFYFDSNRLCLCVVFLVVILVVTEAHIVNHRSDSNL